MVSLSLYYILVGHHVNPRLIHHTLEHTCSLVMKLWPQICHWKCCRTSCRACSAAKLMYYILNHRSINDMGEKNTVSCYKVTTANWSNYGYLDFTLVTQKYTYSGYFTCIHAYALTVQFRWDRQIHGFSNMRYIHKQTQCIAAHWCASVHQSSIPAYFYSGPRGICWILFQRSLVHTDMFKEINISNKLYFTIKSIWELIYNYKVC